MEHYFFNLFTILGEQTEKGFGFSSNFLEANVINITILLYGLIYILKNFLGSALIQRKEKVIGAIQESEERLQQANLRLQEAEKQLYQTQAIITQIQSESKAKAQEIRESILNQGKFDIEKLTISGKVSITNAERQIKQEIRQQINTLIITRVTKTIKSEIKPEIQTKLIDRSIQELQPKL